jgi:hypothetical protein
VLTWGPVYLLKTAVIKPQMENIDLLLNRLIGEYQKNWKLIIPPDTPGKRQLLSACLPTGGFGN